MIDSQIVTWTAFASLAMFFERFWFTSSLWRIHLSQCCSETLPEETIAWEEQKISSFEPPIQVCTMDHLSKQSYSQTWGRMELSQSLSYSQTPSPWEQGVSGVHFLKLQIKIQDERLFEILLGGFRFFLFRKSKLTECSNHPPDPKVPRFFQTVFGNYYFHTPEHGQS